MLWACVHLPHLALDGVLRRREDPTAPLALVGGPAHARVIVTANASARAAGIRPGQRVSSAEALLAKFETEDADPAARARWHQFLAAWPTRWEFQGADASGCGIHLIGLENTDTELFVGAVALLGVRGKSEREKSAGDAA